MGGHVQFRIELQPELVEIRRLEAALSDMADAAELPAARLYALELILDELLTNTITYGFDGAEGGQITVSIAQDGDLLRVVLQDNAKAFNPFNVPAPDLDGALDDRMVGGLGIHFVRTFADAYRYHHDGACNVVELDIKASDVKSGEIR